MIKRTIRNVGSLAVLTLTIAGLTWQSKNVSDADAASAGTAEPRPIVQPRLYATVEPQSMQRAAGNQANDVYPAIEEELSKILGSRFGGIYLGSQGKLDPNGSLSVLIVEPTEDDVALVVDQMVDQNWQRDAQVYSTQVGRVALRSAIEELDAFVRADVPDDGAISYYAEPNEVVGGVRVKVSSDRVLGMKQFAARELPNIPIEITAGSFTIPVAACTEPTGCGPPLRGGQQINQSGYTCTSGFFGRSKTDNKLYLVTAGHCLYGRSGTWSAYPTTSSFGEPIGKTHRHTYGTDIASDSGIIAVTNNAFWKSEAYIAVWGARGTTRNLAYPIKGASGNSASSPVCFSGAISLNDCGVIVQTGISIWLSDGSTSKWTKNLIMSSIDNVTNGDSGGPVWKVNKVHGIMAAGPVPGADLGHPEWSRVTFYVGALQALRNLNLNISTK